MPCKRRDTLTMSSQGGCPTPAASCLLLDARCLLPAAMLGGLLKDKWTGSFFDSKLEKDVLTGASSMIDLFFDQPFFSALAAPRGSVPITQCPLGRQTFKDIVCRGVARREKVYLFQLSRPVRISHHMPKEDMDLANNTGQKSLCQHITQMSPNCAIGACVERLRVLICGFTSHKQGV